MTGFKAKFAWANPRDIQKYDSQNSNTNIDNRLETFKNKLFQTDNKREISLDSNMAEKNGESSFQFSVKIIYLNFKKMFL